MPGMLLAVLKQSPSAPRPSAEATIRERIIPVTREAVVPSAMIRPARESLAGADRRVAVAVAVAGAVTATAASSGAGIHGGAASVSSARDGRQASRVAGSAVTAAASPGPCTGPRRGGTSACRRDGLKAPHPRAGRLNRVASTFSTASMSSSAFR